MTELTIEERFPHKVGNLRYSDKRVLKSPAGYYIGTTCWVDEGDPWGPYEDAGSRESDYYDTREAAQSDIEKGGWSVRDCIENDFAYDEGLPAP